MKKKDIVLKEKKIKAMLRFSTLEVMSSTLEVFWLASLFITGDIYFDNYNIERIFYNEQFVTPMFILVIISV